LSAYFAGDQERIVGFLLKCFIVVALVYFAANKGEWDAFKAAAVFQLRTFGDDNGKKAKLDPLSELQRAASEKLMGAAREHCLAKPADCLALLKSAAGDAKKPDHKDR
jgi:hypothetical protein